MKYSNNKNVPLPIAVWLATDTYKHTTDPNTISVTTLLKPIKEIILSRRVPEEKVPTIDVSNLLASRLGTAIHDAIEKAWKENAPEALKSLGYSKENIDRIKLNVPFEELNVEDVPVYTELRNSRKIDGWTVTGEFDYSFNGTPLDVKSTKTYSYVKKTSDEDYKLQMSMYKWINPEILHRDIGHIGYIFTDWKAFNTGTKNYPPQEILDYPITLMTSNQIEGWIRNRLTNITTYLESPEELIPDCTPKELWMDPSVFKYYSDPNKLGKATKNFDNYVEAHTHMITKGKGTVIEKKGETTKCKYCSAFPICKQAQRHIAEGLLIV